MPTINLPELSISSRIIVAAVVVVRNGLRHVMFAKKSQPIMSHCWAVGCGRLGGPMMMISRPQCLTTSGAPTAGGSGFSPLHKFIMPANVRRYCIRSC